MGQAVATVISVLLIAAYILALLSGLSALLFLVGLVRFIRYEKRLAKNWNKLCEYPRDRPAAPPAPRRPRGSTRSRSRSIDSAQASISCGGQFK
jgi:hypothetical protein